jgi:hypothetical protein
MLGFSRRTVSIIEFMLSVSIAGASNHFSLIIFSTSFPVAIISSMITFSWLSNISPFAAICKNVSNCSGLNLRSAISAKFSVRRAVIGPQIHLAAVLGSLFFLERK